MVIDPGSIKALVDAGGWTLFVATIALIGIGAVRGYWVPGWIYRQSESRNEKIEAALTKLTEAVRRRSA